MSVIDGTAATLAELFRAGSQGTVAGAVVCDGPMALAVASHLTADELVRLRAAVEAHLDAFGGPTGPLRPAFGGEARGGPTDLMRSVAVPLRGPSDEAVGKGRGRLGGRDADARLRRRHRGTGRGVVAKRDARTVGLQPAGRARSD